MTGLQRWALEHPTTPPVRVTPEALHIYERVRGVGWLRVVTLRGDRPAWFAGFGFLRLSGEDLLPVRQWTAAMQRDAVTIIHADLLTGVGDRGVRTGMMQLRSLVITARLTDDELGQMVGGVTPAGVLSGPKQGGG